MIKPKLKSSQVHHFTVNLTESIHSKMQKYIKHNGLFNWSAFLREKIEQKLTEMD